MRRISWKRALLLVGLLAQLAVPVWMLVKHHLILTRGERVTLHVEVYDPRDLFMGHYVQLTARTFPPALEGVPKNYLRYYCDERYARPFEQLVGQRNLEAELDVRVWRGAALAEMLRIEGVPAYDYVNASHPKGKVVKGKAVIPKKKARKQGTWRFATWKPETLVVDLVGRSWDFRDGVFSTVADSRTHLFIPMRDEILWREVAEALGVPPPASLRLVTPLEMRAFWNALELPTGYWMGSRLRDELCLVLPVFIGLPEGMVCEKPFEEQAKAYYGVLRSRLNNPKDVAFFGALPNERVSEVQAALHAAFPESDWVVPWKGEPLPKGLDLEHVVLLCEAMPREPMPCRWLLAAERVPEPRPSDERWCGLAFRLSTFSLPRSEQTAEEVLKELASFRGKDLPRTLAERTIIALATEALARYQHTHDPQFLNDVDALLLRYPKYTLYHWFERYCASYDDYCRLVREMKLSAASGLPVCLGGWLAVRDAVGDPPEPPKPISPTVEDLIQIGQRILSR